jgi:hypothetical protein
LPTVPETPDSPVVDPDEALATTRTADEHLAAPVIH